MLQVDTGTNSPHHHNNPHGRHSSSHAHAHPHHGSPSGHAPGGHHDHGHSHGHGHGVSSPIFHVHGSVPMGDVGALNGVTVNSAGLGGNGGVGGGNNGGGGHQHSNVVYGRRTALLSMKRKSAYDERLQQQYVYFRNEFISAASNYGVTLPLDIMEDSTGRVINFVRQSGPDFLLQLLLTEIENVHLIRMALSLLVVTLSLLRRCLPQSDGGTAELAISASFSQSSTDWLRHATKRLCDGGAVSVCIQLLLSTYLKDIHELILGLLSQIVATSKEAAGQMLAPLNSHLDNIDAHGNHDYSHSLDAALLSQRLSAAGSSSASTSQRMTSSNSPGPNNSSNNLNSLVALSKETTCLSFLVSMCSLYRNRLTVLAGCADIMVSIVQAFPATIVALRIAQTPTCTLSVMSHVNVKSSAASGGATLAAPAPAVAPGGRHQMGIQNMNSPRSFNLMNPAEATVLYKSPRMTGSSVSSIGGGGERFCYERSAEVEQPNGSVSIAWAGLKLMLRVVMRMITFHQPGCVPGQPHHSQARSTENTDTTEADGAGDNSGGGHTKVPMSTTSSAVESPALLQRVYYCVAYLLHLSSEVTNFTINLPGAEDLLRLAADVMTREFELNEDMKWAIEALRNAVDHAHVTMAHNKRSNMTASPVTGGSRSSSPTSLSAKRANTAVGNSRGNTNAANVSMPTHNYKAAGARVTPLYLTPINDGTKDVTSQVKGAATHIQAMRRNSSMTISSKSVGSTGNSSVKATSASASSSHKLQAPAHPSLERQGQAGRAGSPDIKKKHNHSSVSRGNDHLSMSYDSVGWPSPSLQPGGSPSRAKTAPHNLTRGQSYHDIVKQPKSSPSHNHVILVSEFYAEQEAARQEAEMFGNESGSVPSQATAHTEESRQSLATAQSVAWLFKVTEKRPELPVVVVGQSSPAGRSIIQNNGGLANIPHSPISRQQKRNDHHGVMFDDIADKEMKRLLQKGFYVHGRPLDPLDRAASDLKLNIHLPGSNKGRQQSRDGGGRPSDNSSFSGNSDIDFVDFDISNYRNLSGKDNNAENNSKGGSNGSTGMTALSAIDAELMSLGLHTETSEESPFVMNREQPQYSLDIKPTAKARAHNEHATLSHYAQTHKNKDDKNADVDDNVSAASGAISAITMDSYANSHVNVQRDEFRQHQNSRGITKPSPLLQPIMQSPSGTPTISPTHLSARTATSPAPMSSRSNKATVAFAPVSNDTNNSDDISTLDNNDDDNDVLGKKGSMNSVASKMESRIAKADNRRASLELLSMDAMDLFQSTL
jgi:hypothetical protein